MSAFDLLKRVPCDTGTVQEESECEMLTMGPNGNDWDRHRPGVVTVPMIAFTYAGPRLSVVDATLRLETCIRVGMRIAFGSVPASGRVGTLYVRQDWQSNGDRLWGRFGCVLRIGP